MNVTAPAISRLQRVAEGEPPAYFDLPAGQIDCTVDILGPAAVEGVARRRRMSVDPNGDSRNSHRSAEGGCRHLDCRAGPNIDRAII